MRFPANMVHMEFVECDEEEYRQFVENQERCFFTQLTEYGSVRAGEGFRVTRVALKDSTGIRAAATVMFQPWKKFFRRATIPYGPVIDWDDAALVEAFFTELISWAKKDKATLALRVNPLLVRRPYTDITPGENEYPAAERFDALMADIGAVRVEREFYDSPDIQMRFAYVKDLSGMDFAQAASSVEQVVRTRFNHHGTNGVEVEFLTPDQIGELGKVLHHTASRTDMHEIADESLSYYSELMARLGPGKAFMPAAVLYPARALALIDDEATQLARQLATTEEAGRIAEEKGRPLGKKHHNKLKTLHAREEVLERRKKEVLSVHDENGDRVVLAVSFFVASPHEVVYLVSGSYAEFNRFSGPYLIHRAMFEWATAHGVRWYNMFGITGDFSEDASDAGVLQFKRQFNGYVEEYVGTYDIPLSRHLAGQLGAVG